MRLEVFAKYVDTNQADWTSAFNALIGQINAGASGVVVDGGSYASSTTSFPFIGMLNTSGSTGTGPKAYLNWLIFDRNFVNTGGGYVRMSDVAKESGQNVAHEKLSTMFTVTEPSYVYAYLSNENDTPVDVYFDDFKVTQVHDRVVAGGDFYPFGLQITERQITQEPYKFGYQGQFAEKDSLTNLNQFQLRMYDPRFGRWLSADPYGQFSSPYVGMGNNPSMNTDADGGWTWETAAIGFAVGAGVGYAAAGDLKGALVGGFAGGLLGGASFEYKYSKIGGSWGAGSLGNFGSVRKIIPSEFGSWFIRSSGVPLRELMTWEQARKNIQRQLPEPEHPQAVGFEDGSALVLPNEGDIYKGDRRTGGHSDYSRKYNFDKHLYVPNKIKTNGLYVKVHGTWKRVTKFAYGQAEEGEPGMNTMPSGFIENFNYFPKTKAFNDFKVSEGRLITPGSDLLIPH